MFVSSAAFPHMLKRSFPSPSSQSCFPFKVKPLKVSPFITSSSLHSTVCSLPVTKHKVLFSSSSSATASYRHSPSSPPTSRGQGDHKAARQWATLASSPPIEYDRNLLAGFAALVPVHVQWGEMDAFRHVNNVVYAKYVEMSRIKSLHEIAEQYKAADLSQFLSSDGVGPILKSLTLKYRFPLQFPDTIIVGSQLIDVQPDRFTLRHRIISCRHHVVALDGEGTLVCFDYKNNSKAPLSADMRAALQLWKQSVERINPSLPTLS